MDLRDIILSECLRTCQPQLWTWDVWHISMPVKVKCSCEINMPQEMSILWSAAVNFAEHNYEIKISHISFNSELEIIRFSCNFNTCQVQRILTLNHVKQATPSFFMEVRIVVKVGVKNQKNLLFRFSCNFNTCQVQRILTLNHVKHATPSLFYGCKNCGEGWRKKSKEFAFSHQVSCQSL